MPPDDLALEYAEEEDLFGSENENDLNKAVPLVPPTISHPAPATERPGPAQAGPSSFSYPMSVTESKSIAWDVQERMNQLMERKRAAVIREFHDTGVNSLKSFCMDVVRANSTRIWDIGDMEYSVVAPFLNEVPQEQLVELEESSPHIKKDTDWLWEYFMLQEYPLFHERCRMRQGQPRDRGWRRMFQKAKDDALERQASAIERVTERYKKLEEERASKRIVMIDKPPPLKKARRAGGVPHVTPVRMSGLNGTQQAMAKARQDAQRARIAMTHAAGRYVPPAPARNRTQARPEPYKGIQTPTTAQNHEEVFVAGPRIPRPRIRPRTNDQATTTSVAHSIPDPSQDIIPGAMPTSRLDAERATLPNHLQGLVPAKTTQTSIPWRLPEGDRSKFKPVKTANVPNFEPPKQAAPGVVVDFFGDAPANAPKGFLESLQRSQGGGEGATSPGNVAVSGSSSPASPRGLQRAPPPPAKDVMDILFTRKKKPVIARKG